ncbi:PaaI family thioesterase [Salinithrix halophila]
MTLDGLWKELQDLNPNEVETIHKQVQALKRTRVSPLAYIEEMMNFQSLGFDAETGVYVHRMLVTDELKNRYQILHGGVTATFIDTAMGSTVFQEVGEDRRSVTLDLNVSFLKPASEGWLTAHTEVIKKGRTIIVMETKVKDEQGKLIARASSTFFRQS